MKRIIFRGKFGDLVIPRGKISPENSKVVENFLEDLKYITTDNYTTKMCSCLKQKLLDISFNKSNMSNLSKENFETFNHNIFSDEVDISKYGENISPRKNIIDIKNKCIEFVENFDNPDYKNLLFSGNTGLR